MILFYQQSSRKITDINNQKILNIGPDHWPIISLNIKKKENLLFKPAESRGEHVEHRDIPDLLKHHLQTNGHAELPLLCDEARKVTECFQLNDLRAVLRSV